MLTVTPSMGNTHGVRFRSRPPTNSARNQPIPPPASAASSLFLTPFEPGVVAPLGAPSNELKPWPLAGAGAVVALLAVSGAALPVAPLAPVTFTCTENGTLTGARQTSLLHDWYSTLPESVPDLASAAAEIGTLTETVPS